MDVLVKRKQRHDTITTRLSEVNRDARRRQYLLRVAGLAIMLLIIQAYYAGAQEYAETIEKELAFENPKAANVLIVLNIFGGIKVKGYAGDKVMMTALKTIRGKTQDRLEEGKKEVAVGYIDRGDTLILYMKGQCHVVERADNGEWHYDWDYCQQDSWAERERYDYTIDFEITMPRAANLIVSTVNNGDIKAEDVHDVEAHNVNGSIRLDHINGRTEAHTINGDVDLLYDKTPSEDCRYYTLNGTINATYPAGLAAELSFESFNGEFFTNIEPITAMPVSLTEEKSGKGIRYKISGNHYKVRNGGVHLSFETFNGNVILKEMN